MQLHPDNPQYYQVEFLNPEIGESKKNKLKLNIPEHQPDIALKVLLNK